MINRVVLTGRLTADPVLRYTPSGVAVTTFTLAVNRTFSVQSGKKEADFVSVIAWRKIAENIANYLSKGN
ncbi:MAG: single-stranded DNA-binding protein, partial [Bacillus sp. (in: Bacteria)]|nr:single-stranded DNA-binding protein [Bacillus sp. (in: firmicutes)]